MKNTIFETLGAVALAALALLILKNLDFIEYVLFG